MYDIKMLKAKKLAELLVIAEQLGINDLKGLKKQEVIDRIVSDSADNNPEGSNEKIKI